MVRNIQAPAALLFTAITYPADQTRVNPLSDLLDKLIKSDWHIIGPLPFSTITNYYEEEMGEDLDKIYAVCQKPVSLENAAGFKLKSNLIEDDYRVDGKRIFNIDPGFLTHFNFTLLTTKGYAHRIYLGQGIWSELTLYYQDKHFHPLPWTYPDYKDKMLIYFLEEERKAVIKKSAEF
jgi:hypothetical protein